MKRLTTGQQLSWHPEAGRASGTATDVPPQAFVSSDHIRRALHTIL